MNATSPAGRLRLAPENFLSPQEVRLVAKQARSGRRDFLRGAFAAATAGMASAAALAQTSVAAGDPNILELPEHSRGLGQGVATDGYGKPSRFEANVQRRPSPGLTQTAQSSVSFAPLQSMFGIVTPSGLHFERHHQGWWDIDPSRHRLMVNGSEPGMVKSAQVFTMDDLMRLPSVSFAPLQSMFGIVTPSGLHFERHHQGWWDIDPSRHRLMVNGSEPGMVKSAQVFTVDDLMRLPSVSRFHFIECGANTGMEWGNVAVPTAQYTHGMLSCCEFTGVPLIMLLEMAGADLRRGKFVLAEGADGSSMTRTIPMSQIRSGEVLVAYGQNGEMLRPENGYPLRLVVPGVQGVSWVKYLRRIEVGDKPYATKDEALHYIDLMPGGLHRQYTSIQECKSVVTTPSGGQVLLHQGFCSITGLAWSGRGKVRRVDVSVDGGRSWRAARLQTPVLDKCLTRFNLDWVWDGKPAIVLSRATDSTGQVQPTYRENRAVRGSRSIYHNNSVQSWMVQENGEVKNVQLA